MIAKSIARAAVTLAMAAFSSVPASAQSAGDRTVEQYTCKDIMRESGSPREVTIAFMHGYLLGKAGKNNFNIETLLKQTDAFIDRCLENPRDKALETLSKVAN